MKAEKKRQLGPDHAWLLAIHKWSLITREKDDGPQDRGFPHQAASVSKRGRC